MRSPLSNLLHAYQLENYRTRRFLRFVLTRPLFLLRGSSRQQLKRTTKARLLCFSSLGLWGAIIAGSYFWWGNIFATLATGIISAGLFPLLLIFAHILILPLDRFIKRRIITKARRKLRRMKHLTVIGITGSFGKTSQKEILEHVLGDHYKILSSMGNKNTPLGVSEVILKQLHKDHEIFLVEMGAYQKGDIKKLCKLVRPSIGILTGITAQHLERFGSMQNIIDTKFELLEALPKDGIALVNFANEHIQDARETKKKKIRTKHLIKIPAVDVQYKDKFEGISFKYDKLKFETKLLAKHSAGPIIVAYEIGRQLGVKAKKVLTRVATLPYVQHRLELIKNIEKNILVIDDSFNGNIEGVRSTMDLLQQVPFKGRRVYLTPGLVELGDLNEEIHLEIGRLLAKSADLILLIESEATKYIRTALDEQGFASSQIKTYSSTQDAHDDLPNVLQSGDLIVFQNDWTDNYF